ncbi:MAG TPA: glycosyltransferase family 4 protein [Dehalococcoidia bacterium]|nr:glycosyltransferase family 4 protein [Dehalococcoidia bacterium]
MSSLDVTKTPAEPLPAPRAVPTGVPSRAVAAGRTYRVLTIAPTSFFYDYGCHVRIYEETRFLQALGNDVTICTYHTGRDVPGVHIRRALNTPWRRTVQVGSSLHKIYYDALLAVLAAETALRIRPDVIHSHLHEGALIGLPIKTAQRIPLVFDFQGSLTSEMIDHRFLSRRSAFYGPLDRLERIINQRADAIITSSHNAADLLIREFGCSAAKVFTVRDSVDTDRFRPRDDHSPVRLAAIRSELGLPANRPIVVYLGLLAPYQGISHLLRAAAELRRRGREAFFLIMGYPGVDRYQSEAASLGLSDWVRFTGRVPYDRAPEYLALGDLAVSPKVSETESNGKLLNYMAVGLPTVTFDTPVAREILGDVGVYARAGDERSLADHLELLLRDEAGQRDLGRRLRWRAMEEFSWWTAGRQILDVYEVARR